MTALTKPAAPAAGPPAAAAGPAVPHSREARQRAAVILEVLAGVRTPQQAAEALHLGVPRYYQVESRALDGLVAACEPAPRGPGLRPEQVVARLEKECQRLQRELARQQALVRLGQRSIGLAAPAAAKGSPARRRRKPAVRALTAARRLQEPTAPTGATESPPAGS